MSSYDVKVNVYGGGINGQAESVRLAISRALCEINEENRSALKKKDYWPEILEWLKERNLVKRKQEKNSNSRNVNSIRLLVIEFI